MSRRQLFVFGWPSTLGGADTRLVHTLPLWTELLDVTVVPNDAFRLREQHWVDWLAARGATCLALERLPSCRGAVGLAFSNERFFSDRIAHRAKERGLFVIWSSEMMWHHRGELDAVRAGIVDAVLYTSELNRGALQPGYRAGKRALTEHVIGNYVDPAAFPYRRREASERFTIGRLSRPDPLKYPEDFPPFYELLGLKAPSYRVMAWNAALAAKYRWHDFGPEWTLLDANQQTALEFLHGLDAYVYPLGHDFTESWGRTVVEAMLTGLPIVVPDGHHFSSYPQREAVGYCCASHAQFAAACQRLEAEPLLRLSMGESAHRFAREALCERADHVRQWREVFDA